MHFSYRCLRVSPGFAKSRPKMLNIERRPLREFERITRERFKIITFSSSHLSQVKMCPLKRPVKTEKKIATNHHLLLLKAAKKGEKEMQLQLSSIGASEETKF